MDISKEEAKFRILQVQGPTRIELDDMTEYQVYAHVRTRAGIGPFDAEGLLTGLCETGSATVEFETCFGAGKMVIERQS